MSLKIISPDLHISEQQPPLFEEHCDPSSFLDTCLLPCIYFLETKLFAFLVVKRKQSCHIWLLDDAEENDFTGSPYQRRAAPGDPVHHPIRQLIEIAPNGTTHKMDLQFHFANPSFVFYNKKSQQINFMLDVFQ